MRSQFTLLAYIGCPQFLVSAELIVVGHRGESMKQVNMYSMISETNMGQPMIRDMTHVVSRESADVVIRENAPQRIQAANESIGCKRCHGGRHLRPIEDPDQREHKSVQGIT